jgi:K+-sensing histidine kinase KdpD
MKKILYIDDNTNLLEEILEALNFEGFDVYGASGGFDGIEIAKREKPDLILCDIMMQEIDGFEVYKQLKEDTSTSLIPFIFLTALAEQNEIRKGMELGVDDYIVKPILLEDLLNAIRIRLQKSEEINNQIKIKLNEFRNRVLHVLPHELLTPLNGILGFASIIKDHTESINRSEIKEMASHIESSGNRLLKSVNNYLKYVSIISKNCLDIKIELICVHELIEKVSRHVAEKYNRVDDLIFKLENAELMIEYNDMVFLIMELVDNAFKFSNPNSNVMVMNTCINDQIEIQIKDHGIGFPIDNLCNIGAFNQFNREKLEQQGSGLGLITSILIAQRYKGHLHVIKTTIGTEVKLTFPLSKQVPA